MNIFNDAARPHRATWLSPFFVVIEFSKAMWQNDHDFKNRLPGAETKSSFARLKKVNLPSCLSDGLVWLLHWLKDWRLCAMFDSFGTLPPPYGSQQVLTRFLPSAKCCAEWQRLMCFSAPAANSAKPEEIATPVNRRQQSKLWSERSAVNKWWNPRIVHFSN